MSRRLILTADDFGHSPAVNEAVLAACREGVLRHASLMVAGDAAEEAARLARSAPPGRLSVGLHLVLCCGRALRDSPLAPGGAFPGSPAACGLRYFLRQDLEPALEAELRAQFERFLSLGLPPSHVDSHANIHVHPVLFPMLLRLAREYGFKRVRLPGGELSAALSYDPRPFASQLGQAFVFAGMEGALGGRPALCPDRTWGLLRSGLMEEGYLLHLLSRLPEGTTEIYFHPTTDRASLPAGRRPTPAHHSRLDFEALTSPRVAQVLRERAIELI